jgi:DNA-binding transcriptional regulator YdaS (Cro superfamily)
MERFRAYWNSLTPEEKRAFAAACGTTEGYLRKAFSVGSLLGPELCVAIEIASAGRITRQDLRPDDFGRFWPELRTQAVG